MPRIRCPGTGRMRLLAIARKESFPGHQWRRFHDEKAAIRRQMMSHLSRNPAPATHKWSSFSATQATPRRLASEKWRFSDVRHFPKAPVGWGSEAESCGRVFAEQLARANVAPEYAPRTVTGGLRDRALSCPVHCRLGRHPRPHTMPGDIARINTGPYCRPLQDGSDRVSVEPARRQVAMPIDSAEDCAFHN